MGGVVKTYSIRLGTTSNWKVEFRKYFDDGQYYSSLLPSVLPGGIAPEVGTVPPANVYWAGVGPAVGYIMIANTGQNAAAASLAACNIVSATGVIISGVTDGGDYGPITWTSYYGNVVEGPIRDYSGYNVYGVKVIVVGRGANGSTPYIGEGPMYRTYSTTFIMPYYIDIDSQTCPITTPLTPLDPAVQPYEDGLKDMDNVTEATRAGAACIARAARARRPRIIARLVSGYRPPAYQTHIREVYDKWQLLVNNNDPVCADTKRQVKTEFDRHSRFAHQPGTTSRHSTRTAVDISLSNYTEADAIAAECNMSRPVPNDRPHFESPR